MEKDLEIKKYLYEFKGFGIHPGKCIVAIAKMKFSTIVLFIDKAEGTSVTNASEQLATEITLKEGLDPIKTLFFEVYPYLDDYNHSYDEIEYDWDVLCRAKNPRWVRFEKNKITSLMMKKVLDSLLIHPLKNDYASK